MWKLILKWVMPGRLAGRPLLTDEQVRDWLAKLDLTEPKMRVVIEMAMDRAAQAVVSATRVDLTSDQRLWYLATAAALHEFVWDVTKAGGKQK